MDLPYGTRERQFELVGDNCIKCGDECCTKVSVYDNNADFVQVLVNGTSMMLDLCSHPRAPQRCESSRRRMDVPCDSFRICLVKRPDFDKSAKVESVLPILLTTRKNIK